MRLLETSLVRVGNSEYARENGSYGLTTLRTRHVDLNGSTVRFCFRGKGGKRQEVSVNDRRVARVLRNCLDLPGYTLFQYVSEDGSPGTVDAGDVNDYLREIAGADFTANDFRTWAGTVSAARELLNADPPQTPTEARRGIVSAIEEVARQLGNTPSVCRNSYVHPQVLEAYANGELHRAAKSIDDLSEEGVERLVVGVLRRGGAGARAA